MKKPHHREKSRGYSRRRLLPIFFLVGIAGAFIIGPLLQLQWFSGALPFSPWREEKQTATESAERSLTSTDQGQIIRWPAIPRENAPELALHLAPADWFSAYGGNGFDGGKKTGSPENAPNVLSLTLLFPDADAANTDAPCDVSAAAFAACRGALAILQINQTSEIWRQRQLLLGTEKPEPQDYLPYTQRSTRSRYSFWTKTAADGAQDFQGWSCSADSQSARAELALFFALPDHQEPGCFKLGKWWEQFRPAWFAYEEQPAFLECTPHDGCNAWFLFRGRLVNINYEYVGERDAAQIRTQLMVSAWKMLSRLQRDAGRGKSEVDLAALKAQQAACLAFSAEAARWQSEHEQAGTAEADRPGQVAFYLKALCERSAHAALELAQQAPAEALPLLRGLAPALLQSQKIQGRNGALLDMIYSGQMQALEDSQQGESAEMLETQMAAMQEAGSMKQEEEMARINTLLPRALALVHRQGAAVPAATRSALFALINRYYGGAENYGKWRALYTVMLDDIALAYGKESPELIEPLRELGWKNWHDSDFVALKATADQLAVLMLAQPAPGSGSDGDSEAARKREGGAFDALFFYRNYGFHEKRLGEAAGLMAPLATRLDKTLGAEAPLAKAARYHQQEVVSGRAGSGPVGGGFLGY